MPHKVTPKGSMQPVLGRKFCSKCGKWRHLVDFQVSRRSRTGQPLHWQSACEVCERKRKRIKNGHKPRRYGRNPQEVQRRRDYSNLMNNPRRRAALKEYQRIYKETQRRKQDVEPRNFKQGGSRDKGMTHLWGKDAIPAGPFLEWLDDWQAHQDKQRSVTHHGFDRPVASLQDLARLAGVAEKTFQRARNEGRISLQIVDKVLTRASDTCLECMYPETDFPALYVFDDLEVAS